MRIMGWEAEGGIHPRLEFIRQMMLQSLRFGVDLVPWHAERFRQIQFQKAVVTDNLQRDFAAGFGQFRAFVGFVRTSLRSLNRLIILVTEAPLTCSSPASGCMETIRRAPRAGRSP